MVERQGPWPGAVSPPSGWLPPAPAASPYPYPPPSGLFPRQPVRPVYREPHPIHTAPVLAGIGSTLIWLALFGSIGRDLFSYAWWTLVASVTAWVVAGVLTFVGDRGVATGVAATAGFGLSVATVFVATRWVTTGNWPLW